MKIDRILCACGRYFNDIEFHQLGCRFVSKSFAQWWSKNHPLDWWTKERGKPVDNKTRALVWNLCRQAFEDATMLQSVPAEVDADHRED